MKTRTERGGVLGIVLAVILGVAFLGVMAFVLAGLYVARNVHVEKTETAEGESVRVSTPIGGVRVHKRENLDPEQLDIPIYPGAVLRSESGHSAGLELDFGDEHKELNISALQYTTADPADKVLEFYRKELPHWIISRKRHNRFRIEYTEGGYKRIIGIRERHGRTEIALAAVGEPAVN
ncbi:MAG: hypothetical protein IT158_24145 [Bryobacterales bacterium]|nr:hypothetical protein [Bryobacterales bacterium]